MNARRSALRLAGWIGAGVLSVGLLAGIADAVTTSSAPAPAAPAAAALTQAGTATPAPGPGARRDRPGRFGWLHRLNHGTIWLNTPTGEVQADIQAGVVTAVDRQARTITVQSPNYTATYTVGPDSRLRRLGNRATIGDVQVGDRVFVIAIRNGSVDTIRRLADRGPRGTNAPAPGSGPAAFVPGGGSSTT